jgi:spore coat polysaccharide biosynthesis protein SpsF
MEGFVLTGIVLQARMGSSRLPGKVMKNILDRPMLGHILDRLRRVKNADRIIVATTVLKPDDAIEAFVLAEGAFCYRGDEKDVLDRYYRTALQFKLANIVRTTADNPLVDTEEITRLIHLHQESSADYTHAFGQLPIGVGTECFTLNALERSWREGTKENHREHVNEYIQENPDLFHIEQLRVPEEKRASSLRLTVDTQEDFDKMKAIYDALHGQGRHITTEEAIRICAARSV